MSTRIVGFGKEMAPRKARRGKAISKRPRPVRKLKMMSLRLPIVDMQKELIQALPDKP